MREIRFRAWHKMEKRMFNVDFLGRECVIENVFDGKILQREIQICEVEVMQFTGLFDRHGREIFEGDILGGIWEPSYIAWCKECCQFQLHLSLIKNYGPCQSCEGDVNWSELVKSDDLEVVGNIYSNPDLLKEPA